MSYNKSRDHPDDDYDRDYQSSKRARTSRIDEISSDYSQPRSHSIAGIIDEKPIRNGNPDIVPYYVAPKASSDAGSDTKKRSRSYVRPVIRSAVPNSQIQTIVQRPSKAGNVGQRIELYTNHFSINFSKRSNDVILYQFDVDVEILMRDGSWRSCKKDERFQVLKK
jgi:hypothetical protein